MHAGPRTRRGTGRTAARRSPSRPTASASGLCVALSWICNRATASARQLRSRGTSLSAGSSVSHAVAIPAVSMRLVDLAQRRRLAEARGRTHENELGRRGAFESFVDRSALQHGRARPGQIELARLRHHVVAQQARGRGIRHGWLRDAPSAAVRAILGVRAEETGACSRPVFSSLRTMAPHALVCTIGE